MLCSSQTVEPDKQISKNHKNHHSATLYTWQIMNKISWSFHSFSVFGLQAGFTPLTSQPVLYRVVSVRRESKWWSVMSCDPLWILSILVSTLMLNSVRQRLCHVSKSIKCLFMTCLVGHTKTNMSSRFNHFPSCVLFDSRNLGCPQVCKRLLVLVLDLEHGWRDMFIYFHIRVQW